MKLVNVGDEERRQHEEEEHVAEDEVGSKVTKLGNLAEKFTTGLGERVPSEGVPLSGPPSDIRCVGAELTSEGDRNNDLVDEALDGNDCNHSEESLRELEALKEEHDKPESNHHDDSDSVSNSSQNSTKLLAAHAEDRSHTAGHTEECKRNTGVDSNWSECNNADTDEGVGRLEGRVGCGLVVVPGHTGASVDVEVRNESDSNGDERAEHLTHKEGTNSGTRRVARKLG